MTSHSAAGGWALALLSLSCTPVSRFGEGAGGAGAGGDGGMGGAGCPGGLTSCPSGCEDLVNDLHHFGACGFDLTFAQWPMPHPDGGAIATYTVDEANDVVLDRVTGLTWQRAAGPGTYVWAQAKLYCDNLSYGGQSDWRLPTRIELVSLLDYTKLGQPSIDADAFPETVAGRFWTASESSAYPQSRWTVDFEGASTSFDEPLASHAARCVRGGAP
jgi:hypothetical protein